MKATENILSYSKGEITLEEANERLAKCTAGLQLDPMKNAITGAEMVQTRSDGTPAGTTGWGFMNHGVGTPEKMHVTAGKLDYDTGFDVKGNAPKATLYIAGYAFAVVGDHIEVKVDEG